MNNATPLYRSTVGKKAILAVTGFALLVFVFAHMLANLQIFAGRAQLDGYARALRGTPTLLWGARLALTACLATHVLVAIALARRKRAARPARYRFARKDVQASIAARTMTASGVLLALFVPLHLANLTWGTLHPRFVPLAAYDNVVALFRILPVSALYGVALLALGLHLVHGAWSLFLSLGVDAPSATANARGGALRRLAKGVGVATAVGFASVVAAVATGFVR
jgi:succinate dehydrogenase / fumarate reductase cytochrome b subunit